MTRPQMSYDQMRNIHAQIVRMIKANRLKVNRHFQQLIAHGFSDTASESFGIEVLDDLDHVLIYGINNGFGGGVKKTVAELAELAVKAGGDNCGVTELEKLHCKKSKIRVPCASDSSTKSALIAYVRSSKTGMDLLKNPAEEMDSKEKENLKECRNLLDKISVSIEGVVDVTSQAAADEYDKIVNGLMEWRNKQARAGGYYSRAAVDELNTVLSHAKNWGDLCTFDWKRSHGKFGAEIPMDDLARVIESESIMQDAELFLEHCDRFANSIAKKYNDSTREQLRDLRKQLKEIEAREQKVVVCYQHGNLTRDDAELELEEIEQKRDTVEFNMERLEDQAGLTDDIVRCRKMLLSIERPIRMNYNCKKHNRLHIYELFKGVDFAGKLGMLNGNVSTAEFERGVDELRDILITNGVICEQLTKQGAVLEQALSTTEQALGHKKETEQEIDRKNRIDSLLGLKPEVPQKALQKEAEDGTSSRSSLTNKQ